MSTEDKINRILYGYEQTKKELEEIRFKINKISDLVENSSVEEGFDTLRDSIMDLLK